MAKKKKPLSSDPYQQQTEWMAPFTAPSVTVTMVGPVLTQDELATLAVVRDASGVGVAAQLISDRFNSPEVVRDRKTQRGYSEHARLNTGPRKKQYESEHPDWRQAAIAELVKHPGRRDKKLVTEVRKATRTLAARSTVNAWIKRDGVEIRANAESKALQNSN